MTGTLINVIAVIAGSLLGTLFGARLPDKMRETVLAGLGISTFVVGLSMALTGNILIVMFSLLLGAVIGEGLGLDEALNRLGRRLEERFARGEEAGRFSRGFVTASLVFVIGPLAIIGPIQDGLVGNYQLLAVKSILDGFASLAFASSLGIGVAFSSLSLLLYQGSLSLAAMLLGSALGAVTRETPWVVQLSATGGAIIMGIGLLLLDLRRLRLANFLPALVIAPLIVAGLSFFKIALP